MAVRRGAQPVGRTRKGDPGVLRRVRRAAPRRDPGERRHVRPPDRPGRPPHGRAPRQPAADLRVPATPRRRHLARGGQRRDTGGRRCDDRPRLHRRRHERPVRDRCPGPGRRHRARRPERRDRRTRLHGRGRSHGRGRGGRGSERRSGRSTRRRRRTRARSSGRGGRPAPSGRAWPAAPFAARATLPRAPRSHERGCRRRSGRRAHRGRWAS